MKALMLSRKDKRDAAPIMLRLSEEERRQLQKIAQITGIPMATLVYQATHSMLQTYQVAQEILRLEDSHE